MKIVDVDESNFEQVLPLIEAYQVFYKATPNREANLAYFPTLFHDESKGKMFAAFSSEGEALGFATFYLVPSSVRAGIGACFNDLYTVDDERGHGVGIALAMHLFRYAKKRGFNSIGWHTQKENERAQRLYDFTPAKRSEWVNYDLELP